MTPLEQSLINEYHRKDLAKRKHWYSPAAEAYQQARPRYPKALTDRAIEIAGLSSDSSVLEIGCGPAIATPNFATLGCRMVCIEPNPDFYALAQSACEPYRNVEVQNCSFEEWELVPQHFDAVLAATSFHWISPEIGYPKVAATLRPGGYLILLWNKELQPSYEVYQELSEVYKIHAPSLSRPYEDVATQIAILDELGQMAIASGQFQDMQTGHMEVKVTYSIDRYLLLLNTYSPYLKLEAQQKQNLFTALRQFLEKNSETIQLSYVSAFHTVRLKCE